MKDCWEGIKKPNVLSSFYKPQLLLCIAIRCHYSAGLDSCVVSGLFVWVNVKWLSQISEGRGKGWETVWNETGWGVINKWSYIHYIIDICSKAMCNFWECPLFDFTSLFSFAFMRPKLFQNLVNSLAVYSLHHQHQLFKAARYIVFISARWTLSGTI